MRLRTCHTGQSKYNSRFLVTDTLSANFSDIFSGFIILITVLISSMVLVLFSNSTVWAEGTTNLIMTPMNEKIILNPGESYSSSFTITTSSNATLDFDYEIYIQSYYRDKDNKVIFEDIDGHGQMSNWITIDSPESGTIKLNDYIKVNFTINVPENAPAGGQYAVITVGSAPKSDYNTGVNINETVAIAYTIYAEITGTTYHQGEIIEANVPGFLFSGNIYGDSSIKNTGNVHGKASYTLQVYPLFSNEAVYSNVDNPETHLILPDITLYNETTWDDTPMVGIYNVVYKALYEGVEATVSKIVIVCPAWLLIVIVFIITMFIFWIVHKYKKYKKKLAKKKAKLTKKPKEEVVENSKN